LDAVVAAGLDAVVAAGLDAVVAAGLDAVVAAGLDAVVFEVPVLPPSAKRFTGLLPPVHIR
jgi:hypothetical protein